MFRQWSGIREAEGRIRRSFIDNHAVQEGAAERIRSTGFLPAIAKPLI